VSEQAVLRASGLSVAYGARGRQFRLEVSGLELQAGHTLAILGPNGAGKSTLLRSLAGLQRGAEGRVEGPGAGRVTMVFQRPLAFDGSVSHNVRVALWGRGLSRAEQDRRIETALSHFGIAAMAQQSAATLSFGELRRLSLARALCIEPSVLLLDEPFDDLDAQGREALSRDLRRVVHETGVALCLVTHDLSRAVLLADRIAILLDGRIRQQGPVDQLLARPVDAATATLLGMHNLVPVRVGEPGDDGLCRLRVEPAHDAHGASAGHGGAELWAPCDLPAGSAAWLGLRPERLKLGRPGTDAPRGAHANHASPADELGHCQILEHSRGAELTTLTLSWAGHTLRTHFVSGRGPLQALNPGDRVPLSSPLADRHVMPRETAPSR